MRKNERERGEGWLCVKMRVQSCRVPGGSEPSQQRRPSAKQVLMQQLSVSGTITMPLSVTREHTQLEHVTAVPRRGCRTSCEQNKGRGPKAGATGASQVFPPSSTTVTPQGLADKPRQQQRAAVVRRQLTTCRRVMAQHRLQHQVAVPSALCRLMASAHPDVCLMPD